MASPVTALLLPLALVLRELATPGEDGAGAGGGRGARGSRLSLTACAPQMPPRSSSHSRSGCRRCRCRLAWARR